MPVRRRNPLDLAFSKLVRERANWCCEACGTYFPEGQRARLHCSHIIGRNRWAVRFDPMNAAAHCDICHYKFTDNPLELAEWARAHLGEKEYQALKIRANRPFRTTAPLKKDLYENLKASLKQMEAERKDGRQGRLDFENPYPLEVA